MKVKLSPNADSEDIKMIQFPGIKLVRNAFKIQAQFINFTEPHDNLFGCEMWYERTIGFRM